MSVTVRVATAADLPAVQRCMHEVFIESGGQKAAVFDEPLWRWQYLEGERPALVVMAEADGQVCGYYHALLVLMRRDGRTVLGAMVQDVGTLASFRGRGIFRDMGGFALGALRERGVEFIYTFPNERSRPSFERNHAYQRVARVPVWVAPLDVGGLVAGRAGVGALGTLLAPVSALVRGATGGWGGLAAGERMASGEASPAELAALATAFAGACPVGLQRTADFFTWRFARKPGGQYATWTLHAPGPVAYVVTSRTVQLGAPCVAIMDVGCAPGAEGALARLVRARLAAERATGAQLGLLMGLHPVLGQLPGFVRLPEALNPRPFNLLTRVTEGTEPPALLDPRAWHITLADWDVL